jgi:CRISPR-associated endonuclease Csn1
MFDAHQPDISARRPHPAAKKVLSLRQNDLVAIEKDGGPRELMRVVKFSSIGQITFAPHNEGGPLKTRDGDGSDPFRYTYLAAGSLKKAKARQVRIDPLGRVFDPGPRE